MPSLALFALALALVSLGLAVRAIWLADKAVDAATNRLLWVQMTGGLWEATAPAAAPASPLAPPDKAKPR